MVLIKMWPFQVLCGKCACQRKKCCFKIYRLSLWVNLFSLYFPISTVIPMRKHMVMSWRVLENKTNIPFHKLIPSQFNIEGTCFNSYLVRYELDINCILIYKQLFEIQFYLWLHHLIFYLQITINSLLILITKQRTSFLCLHYLVAIGTSNANYHVIYFVSPFAFYFLRDVIHQMIWLMSNFPLNVRERKGWFLLFIKIDLILR